MGGATFVDPIAENWFVGRPDLVGHDGNYIPPTPAASTWRRSLADLQPVDHRYLTCARWPPSDRRRGPRSVVRRPCFRRPPNLIAGPFAGLLAQSTDLGPAHSEPVRITAEPARPAIPPVRLTAWASPRRRVHWRAGRRPGDRRGMPGAVADASRSDGARRPHFGRGARFYAAPPQQPAVCPRGRGRRPGPHPRLHPAARVWPPTPPRDVLLTADSRRPNWAPRPT